MKRKNIINVRLTAIYVMLACVLSYFEQTYAALVIDPAYITIDLTNKRATGTFLLKNTGDEEERYRAKAVYFTLTPKGSIKELSPDEYSLTTWIKFNPQEFVLPPKSSRAVRYSVIPQGKLKAYEYRGAIEFIPLKAANVKSQDDAGHIINLKVISVVLVPIYGYVRGTKNSGNLKQIAVNQQKDEIEVTFTVVNTGNGVLRLDGICQIITSAGKVADELGYKKIAVFPKNERIIKMKTRKELKPDNYILKVRLKSIDSRSDIILSGETKFAL